GDDAVAGAIALAGHLLADREHRLGAPEVDDDVASLEAAHDAGDQLAAAILILVEDVLALGLPHALDDDLLGGLRGDTTEMLDRIVQVEHVAPLLLLLGCALLLLLTVKNLEQQLVAGLGLGIDLVGVADRDLAAQNLGRLGDRDDQKEIHDARLVVV